MIIWGDNTGQRVEAEILKINFNTFIILSLFMATSMVSFELSHFIKKVPVKKRIQWRIQSTIGGGGGC